MFCSLVNMEIPAKMLAELILTETKLDLSVNLSEFLPEHYKGDIRRYNKKGAGGVMMAYKDSLVAVQAEIPQVKAQTMWANVESRSSKPTQIGAYYHPPSDRTPDTVDDLNTVMENLDPDCPIIFGGDYNIGGIIWESNTVAPNSDRKQCERLFEVLESHHLGQIQREPTREQAVLHYNDAIMGAIAPQITSLTSVNSAI